MDVFQKSPSPTEERVKYFRTFDINAAILGRRMKFNVTNLLNK